MLYGDFGGVRLVFWGAALILPAGRTLPACSVAVILPFLVQDMGWDFSPSLDPSGLIYS